MALKIEDFFEIVKDIDNRLKAMEVTPVHAFASIYVEDANDTISITASGEANIVQITSFDTNGEASGMTPDHTNDHIVVDKAGRYMCTASITCASGAGLGFVVDFSVYKNNGTTYFNNVHGHRTLAGGGGDVGSVTISGIIDLEKDDTVELWCYNEDNTTDVIIINATLTLIKL